ncbi:hypothetical protein EBZ35_08450 [bacterium]|nr:hypothetical protein [bacterium]
MGQADAQVAGLIEENPKIKHELESIRVFIKQAESDLQDKEKTIDTLSQTVAKEQEKAETRLVLIWKLTSILLGILVVGGIYIAWKLR